MIVDPNEGVPQADPSAAPPPVDAPPRPRPDDAALGAIVARLARPHRSGGRVVERAALMAAGTDFSALVHWIEKHDGVPELPAAPTGAQSGGLFAREAPTQQQPLRFVLPATAFG